MVLIVEDDEATRRGIAQCLELYGFSAVEASTETEALVLARSHPLEAAVLDIELSRNGRKAGGLQLIRPLKDIKPSLGIVVFSHHSQYSGDITTLLQEGHRGLVYQLKGGPAHKLLDAIENAIAGHIVIDPEVYDNRPHLAEEMLRRLTNDERVWVGRVLAEWGTLTNRERETAELLAASYSQAGIAQRLGVGNKAVEAYVVKVYQKTGLNDMKAEAPHLSRQHILVKACQILDLSQQT